MDGTAAQRHRASLLNIIWLCRFAACLFVACLRIPSRRRLRLPRWFSLAVPT